MSWLKIDDKFPRHRRIRELRRDTAAKWLHVTALCFCSEHLTDGRIDDVDLPAIIHGSELSTSEAKRSIDNLVKVGLWEEGEAGGYIICDFFDVVRYGFVAKTRRRWNRLRLWQQFEGRCHLCGDPVSLGEFHVEHVVPLSRGGEDRWSNLNIAHSSCNLSKGSRMLEEIGLA